jgi:hypothetical protein
MGGFAKNITKKKKITKTTHFDKVKKHEFHDKRGGCSTKKWLKWFTNIFK